MQNRKEKPIVNVRSINKMRCIIGIVICSIVIVLTVVAFTLNVIDFYSDNVPEAGIGTLRMFTTLSNIIAAVGASLCLPFQIDGLRRNKYKLPKWIVETLFVGAVGVLLTFLVAISAISASRGFVYAMLEKTNIFMHTLNPIFIVLLFSLAVSDHHIKFLDSIWTLLPTIAYAFLYFIMVFVTHQWNDHYQVESLCPWPVAAILILAIAFGASQLLRFLHNLTNKYVTAHIEKYYKESPDYEFSKITEAIFKLSEEESKSYREGEDIYIPIDIIKLLSERYNTSTLPLDIQYDIYLEHFLACIHPKKEENEDNKNMPQ